MPMITSIRISAQKIQTQASPHVHRHLQGGFRKLAADGTVFTGNTFRALKATYYRSALDLLEGYYNDAKMNGLAIDRHEEETAIELFAENIMRAGQVFIENPHETPFIPTWNRVHSADPRFLSDMRAAAAADEAEYQ